MISKANYKIHTDAIKETLLLPKISLYQINYTYASEADVLNVALFGMTAKDWKNSNKNKEGNIRDYATIEQLIVLSNLESSNSIMLRDNIPQNIRLKKLNEYALIQLKSLCKNAINDKIRQISLSVKKQNKVVD